MKTFLSFSSKDKDFVSKFKARIIAQKLDLWDYSREGEEIPVGKRIDAYLKHRVMQVELFIPLVTENSIQSEYTKIEVETALNRQKKKNDNLIIIPVVEKSMLSESTKHWGDVYHPLKKIRYFSADFNDRKDWESVISGICYSLKIEYMGLVPDNTLLPFMQNFEDELKEAKIKNGERFDSIFRKLEEIRNRFSIAVDEQNYESAYQHIELFINICNYEFSQNDFYFSHLAKAVCLIGLGKLNEALDVAFSIADNEKPFESKVGYKETRLGIIGYIKQAQGLFKEAAQYYEEAFRIDPADTAAATGVVVNRLLSNNFEDIEDALKVIENGKYYTEHDRQNAQAARAFAMAAKGNSDLAVKLFYELINNSTVDPAVYINLSRALYDLGRYSAANKILESGIKNCVQNLDIFKWKMNFHLSLSENQEALNVIQNATSKFPENHELAHYLQQCLVYANKIDEARVKADSFLQSISYPKNPDEFYYTGFANFILNNKERADYDFERSGRDESEYYSNAFNKK